ncbi:hypothetical protein ACFORH_17270 [Amycolatopsis roodepoortensis]|uniref:Lipoprotein n=1 Tax=Amycolatopsis roodepoortensis TaxID=700274 RepID=A0ABR9LC03_9PSEU|nr:hypothetical protein [Amycolatopsis roodepoortensis]MBE1578208.1 hypothetical protein [Amycolatopsis roodepoortensis]
MRLPRLIALAACALLLTTACASPGSEAEMNIADPAAVKLGETVVAFSLSPDTSADNPAEKRQPGYLVLVRADGGTQLIETSGMTESHIAWSETGLFFSDDNRDYILGKDGLTGFENKKAGHQQSAFALPGSQGFVAVYNEGFSETGYTNQVAVTTSTGSRLYRVEGNYFMNALCGGVLNGIATDVGAHFAESATIPGMRSKLDPSAQPELLSQLYPATDGKEKVLAWRGVFDAGDHNRHVPCRDGVITFLSDYTDADGKPRTTVVSWNTGDGKYTEQPLVDAEGRPVTEKLVDPETFSQKTYDARALRGGHLEWLAADGRIMTTEIASGVTVPRFGTGFTSDSDSSSQAVFTDRSITLIQERFDGKTPVKIKRFDRATGNLITEITVPGLAERFGIRFNLRGMAVPPAS